MKIRSLLLMLMVLLFSWQSVSADNTKKFSLVTNADSLKDGDTVIIVCKEYSKALSIKHGGSSFDGASVKLSSDGKTVWATDSIQRLVLNKENSYWLFRVGKEYMCTASPGSTSAKLTTREDYKKGTTKYVRTKITIDNKTGEALIIFDYPTNYRIKYSKFDNIFKNYAKTATAYSSVFLYVPSSSLPLDLTLDGDNQSACNTDSIKYVSESDMCNITVNRTFVGDDGWYTLCLPFALTASDISDTFLGATFYKYSTVSEVDGDKPCLNFKSVSSTEAGQPYLMRMKDGKTVANPVFKNKQISEKAAGSIEQDVIGYGTYSFIGIFDPVSIADQSGSYFIGSSGKNIVKAADDGTMLKGLRAYFTLPSTSSSAKIGVDGEYTDIRIVEQKEPKKQDVVFSLDGQRVNSTLECLPNGIYIIGGKKQVVRH